jgi:hypothetical protein
MTIYWLLGDAEAAYKESERGREHGTQTDAVREGPWYLGSGQQSHDVISDGCPATRVR